ncbi:MAG: hypothetical protein GY814_20575 [Gammaproteobacteria bacterium]|nr:hypothetical protein [Gammaproteobacteria bacterium]
MEENKKIFSNKASFNSNLVVPVIVVVLLTALAVWLVPGDDVDQDAKKPLPGLGSVVQSLDPPDSAKLPSGQTSADGAPTTKDPDANNQPGGVIDWPKTGGNNDARSVISQLKQDGGNAPQKAFDAAEKQRSMGNNEDAYLLYFYAAKQGHGASAHILGTQSDPAFFTSINSAFDAPDQGQAIKWYQVAIDAGNKEAKQHLAELAERIQQEAESGSGEAQRLLLQLR